VLWFLYTNSFNHRFFLGVHFLSDMPTGGIPIFFYAHVASQKNVTELFFLGKKIGSGSNSGNWNKIKKISENTATYTDFEKT
jgi:hypothetical protein